MYMGTAPPQCGGRALTLKRRVGETTTPATSSTANIKDPTWEGLSQDLPAVV